MDGGAWWAAVHGVAKSRTRLSDFDFSLSCIGEGNGNPLQYSCLENPRDGGAWWAAIYGVAQSRTRLKRLSSSSKRASRFSACGSKHACGTASLLHLSHIWRSSTYFGPHHHASAREVLVSLAPVSGSSIRCPKWPPLADIVLCLTFCVTNCCRTWP